MTSHSILRRRRLNYLLNLRQLKRVGIFWMKFLILASNSMPFISAPQCLLGLVQICQEIRKREGVWSSAIVLKTFFLKDSVKMLMWCRFTMCTVFLSFMRLNETLENRNWNTLILQHKVFFRKTYQKLVDYIKYINNLCKFS